ncbi:MAG: YbhB/YbcL family Raf kinase inhibitor-like protein [archaeon]
MIIQSPAFNHNEKIPIKYTADGTNINPELNITKIPENTKSLILIMDDPDAQKVCGFTWIHWVLFNIPVNSNQLTIQKNSISGTPGESTYKKPEYNGPNPPAGSGTHNYNFKIYALDKKLELPEMTPLPRIIEAMKNHIVAESILTGKYSRD